MVEIGGRKINNMRYAVDAVLIADSEEKLKTLVQQIGEHSEAMGKKINKKKTKAMVVAKKDRSHIIHLRIDSDEIE